MSTSKTQCEPERARCTILCCVTIFLYLKKSSCKSRMRKGLQRCAPKCLQREGEVWGWGEVEGQYGPLPLQLTSGPQLGLAQARAL